MWLAILKCRKTERFFIAALHCILLTVKTRPDVIAISDTKINENSYANINLPGNKFVNTNSKSQAGGFGLYLMGHRL